MNNNTGESSFLTTSITLDLSQNGIQYECVADNTIGTGSDLITITVQGKFVWTFLLYQSNLESLETGIKRGRR